MKILLVAATELETGIVREKFSFHILESGLSRCQIPAHTIDLIHTGVGQINVAYHLGKHLANSHYDLAFQFGIAGANSPELQIGDVVEVREEIIGDLGADSPKGFINMKDLGFPVLQRPDLTLYNRLGNPTHQIGGIRRVTGLTVNTVSGTRDGIRKMKDRWDFEIESMEGAAFFYVMLNENIPFHQIRSISNRVEERNRESWDIPLALKTVQKFMCNYLAQVSDKQNF